MLVNLQVPWVILGHSERRALLGESSDFVADKVAYALTQGLKVIACIGETLEQREAGTTMDVVAAQTKAIAEKISDWTNVVLAYEPVWAIGTGERRRWPPPWLPPRRGFLFTVCVRSWGRPNIETLGACVRRLLCPCLIGGGGGGSSARQTDLKDLLSLLRTFRGSVKHMKLGDDPALR